MLFINPWFWLGAFALAGPLLLHLLLRNRPKRQTLPTLRFLPSTSPQSVAMHRVKNLLLLLLRLLILLLIVTAFARPYWKKAVAETPKDQAERGVVFAVDTSLSMRAAGRWSTAQSRVRTLLETLPDDTRIGLILFDRSPRVAVADTRDRALVLSLVKEAGAGYASTDLLASLRSAGEAAQVLPARRRTVYLVSDFQDIGFKQIATEFSFPTNVELQPINVDDKPRSNAAIVGTLEIPSADIGTRALRIQTACYGHEPMKGLLTVNEQGKTLASYEVALKPGDSHIVDAPIRTESKDDTILTVNLDVKDALAEDNTYSVILRSERPLPVMIPTATSRVELGGGSRDGSPLDSNPYLRAAVRACGARLAPSWPSPQDLGKIAAADRPVALVNFSSALGAQAATALKEYVAGGGALIVFPGADDTADLASFCELKTSGWEVVDPREADYRLVSSTASQGPISLLDVSGRTLLGHPKAVRFLKIQAEESESVRRLASFDDGNPFLVERKLGAGVIYVFAVPLDSTATDFVLRAAFSPFLFQLIEYCSNRNQPRSDFVVGDLLPTGPEESESELVLTGPKGESLKSTGSAFSLGSPGVYRLKRMKTDFPVRVLIDPEESDLRAMSATRITGLARSPESAAIQVERMTAARLVEDEPELDAETRIWWWLLLSVLLLMVVETLTASRTLR